MLKFFSSKKGSLALIALTSLLMCLIWLSGLVAEAATAPPAGGKLRVFVQATSGQGPDRGWGVPHSTYEQIMREWVQRILDSKGIYDIVPQREIETAFPKRSSNAWSWKWNDYALAVEVGKKLHAEYAMVIERHYSPSTSIKIILINLNTKKTFEALEFFSGGKKGNYSKWLKAGFSKIFRDANSDLLATAMSKGMVAYNDIEQTRKELNALKEREEPKKSDDRTEVSQKAVIAESKPTMDDSDKGRKIAELEKRLSQLADTFAQLTKMAQLLEEERKKTEDLNKKLKEKEEREKGLMVQLEADSKTPPIIVVASPQDGDRTEAGTVQLTGVVEDDGGVKEIAIFLNNERLKGETSRGVGIVGRDTPRRFDFSRRITLRKGENRIGIRAVDSEGLVSERVLSITKIERQRNIWAVVIGINDYSHVRKLKYAVNDAQSFYNLLVDTVRIPRENITLLTDREAGLTNLRSALGTKLKGKAGKEDMVIIYFAGHGATEKDSMSPDGDGLEKYILPYDADLKDLYSTALPMREISHIFRRIQSERLIFIADSCYSGASGGRTIGLSETRASISEKFIDRIAKGKGRVIITASSANEVSAEDKKLQHGVFTYYLLEALRGKADIDKDGLITVDETYQYVSDKVSQATKQEQHPVKKGTVEGKLVLSIVEQ